MAAQSWSPSAVIGSWLSRMSWKAEEKQKIRVLGRLGVQQQASWAI
jgi:hypothetical protein